MLFYLIFVILQAFTVIFLMNVAMAHYPQIDVVPVFESFGVAFSILTGMVFFDEGRYYTSVQLLELLGSSLVLISGILILSFKTNTVQRTAFLAENQIVEDTDDFYKSSEKL